MKHRPNDNKKKVRFHWGFPVEMEEGSTSESQSNRGVALMIAMFVTAMSMLFLAEMKLSSSVSNQLSLGHHLNVKGEYIAKSGVNLARLLVTADLAIDLSMRELQGKQFYPSDGPDDIWGMLNGLPIGGETLEMMGAMQESFGLSAVGDSKVLDGLKQFDGSFVIQIEDESSKININQCGVMQGTVCKTLLAALMSCPAEKEYLERKKVKIRELVSLIRDWVDTNNRPEADANYSSEGDPYDGKGNAFPKNAPFDSLDELKLIPGWTDDLHKIFSPYLTVYPIQTEAVGDTFRMNFNSAQRAFLNCLMPNSTQECSEKSALYIANRQDTGPVSGVANLKSSLQQNFCTNDKNLTERFSFRSDTYRIKVVGVVEGQTRTLEVVMTRGMPDPLDEKNGFEGTYKYLYWKMI